MAEQISNYKIIKWLHIDEPSGNYWLHPIYTILSKKFGEPKRREIQKKGIHILTRLNMLPHILGRIENECKSLYSETVSYKPEHMFTETDEGCAFRVRNTNIYQLLIDIDSILFEINSLNELIKDLFISLYKLAGKEITRDDAKDIISKITQDSGFCTKWYSQLDSHRNFVTHKGAPYIAIDITTSRQEILIMKENLYDFKRDKKYFRFSELRSIVRGFGEAKDLIIEHLINMLNNSKPNPHLKDQ